MALGGCACRPPHAQREGRANWSFERAGRGWRAPGRAEMGTWKPCRCVVLSGLALGWARQGEASEGRGRGQRAGKRALELPSRGASHGPQPRSGQQSVVSPSQAVMSRVAGGCHLMSMA